MALEGLRPDDVYYKREPEKPKRNAKTVSKQGLLLSRFSADSMCEYRDVGSPHRHQGTGRDEP